MFETILPLSFVPVAIFPHVHAVSSGLGLAPLAYIRVTIDSLPDALAFLEAAAPLTLVHLAIRPSVNALAMWLPVQKFAFVSVSV